MGRAPIGLVVAASALGLVLTGCGAPTGESVGGSTDRGSARSQADGQSGRAVNGRRVLAISVDGLNPRALKILGPRRAPHLTRLMREGLSTDNARTAVEQTVTLPNHTGMVTGRPIDVGLGGHGVTWNDHRPGTTVSGAAGGRVQSVFTAVRAAGGGASVFAEKEKFSLFERSWPGAIATSTADADRSSASAARRDLRRQARTFTFVHLAGPDDAGHAAGFLSATYLEAVRRADAEVGRLLRTVRATPALRRTTVVVLTADHGGAGGTTHDDASSSANFRVPFLVWGPGIERGDLYQDPRYRDPGRRQIRYGEKPPIRNCLLANVSLHVLGLPPLAGSSPFCGG